MFIRPSLLSASWLKPLASTTIVGLYILSVLFLCGCTGLPETNIANHEAVSEIYNGEKADLAGTNPTLSMNDQMSALYQKAEALAEAGKLDSAMLALQPVLKPSGSEKNETYFSALLLMADLLRRNNAPDSAYRLLGYCLQELNHHMPDTNLVWAKYYQRLGALLLSQGEYVAGIETTKRSAELCTRFSGPADTNLVVAYLNLGLAYHSLDNNKIALIYLNRAIQIIEKGVFSGKRIKARIYRNAALNYSAMGDFENANLMFGLAFRQFEGYLQPNDPLWARHYSSYAFMLTDAGFLQDALRYHQKAAQILLQNYDYTHISVGSNLISQAIVYSTMYDYDKAYHFNNLAINIFEQQLQSGDDRLLSSYHNAGVYLMRLSKFGQAHDYLHKSINPTRLNSTNIMAYRNLGVLLHELGQNDEAAYWFEKANTGSIALFGTEHTQTALTNLRYGNYLTDIGDHERAHLMLKQAVEVYKVILGPTSRDYGHALFQWGNNYLKQGKTDKAIEVLHKAVSVFSSGFESDDAMHNPLFDQLARDPFSLNAIYLKAKALHSRYLETGSEPDLQSASHTYQLAIALLSDMRNTIGGEENRLNISRLTSIVLSGAMECAWDLYIKNPETPQLQQALEISEAGKAMVLLSMLHDMQLRQISLLPDEVQTYESSLKHRLYVLEGFIRDEKGINNPDPVKINKWQAELILLKNRQDSLMQAVHRQFPDYHAVKFDLPSTSIFQLQSSLAVDEAVVSYTLTEKDLYVFMIGRDTAHIFKKQIGEGFYQLLITMRRHLSGEMLASYSIHDYHEYLDTAHELYLFLLEPVSEQLTNKKLTIVPDKQLAYLPFEALLTHRPERSLIDFSSLPYLFDKHTVRYTYSTTLDQYFQSQGQETTNGKILALAPEYEGYTNAAEGNCFNSPLLPLPWAVDEVEQLSKAYKSDAYSGPFATVGLFKQKAADYNVLHLAMHTTIDVENPMFSKLYFSHDGDSACYGVLETHELYKMRLNAVFAFLGACNTGDGQMLHGEGVMSFARGFFYAGIQSLVMTLWDVDDLTASQLVISFYDFVAKGYPLDEALRNAKLSYIASADNLKAHPYYWAGYVQIGSNNPIQLPSRNQYWEYAPVLALLLVLGYFILKHLSRKRIN